MLLNVVILVCSIPIVTIPATLVCSMAAIRCIDNVDILDWREFLGLFLRAWRYEMKNWIWLTVLAALLVANGAIVANTQTAGVRSAGFLVFSVLASSWFLASAMIGVRYEMTVWSWFRTGLFVVLANLIRCVPAVGLGLAVGLVSTKAMLAWLTLSASLPLYLFDRFMRKPINGLADLFEDEAPKTGRHIDEGQTRDR